MYKNKTPSKYKKLLIILIAVVLVAGGAYLTYRQTMRTSNASSTAGRSGVNYDPPTEEEKQAANDQKETNIQKEQAIEDNKDKPADAAITVTDASYYQYDGNVVEVRAYLANVYEDGGTCTATFTKGSLSVTKSSTAFKDVSTTQCGALDVPRAQFTEAGSWSVVVKYSSEKYTATSTPKAITITP